MPQQQAIIIIGGVIVFIIIIVVFIVINKDNNNIKASILLDMDHSSIPVGPIRTLFITRFKQDIADKLSITVNRISIQEIQTEEGKVIITFTIKPDNPKLISLIIGCSHSGISLPLVFILRPIIE